MSGPRPAPRPRGLVQAPVTPMDADGMVVASLGILAWLVAGLAVWWADGSRVWVLTCLAGAVIGLVGVGWLVSRRRRHLPDNPSVHVGDDGHR